MRPRWMSKATMGRLEIYRHNAMSAVEADETLTDEQRQTEIDKIEGQYWDEVDREREMREDLDR